MTSKPKTKQKRVALAKELLKKETRVGHLNNSVLRSSRMPKWAITIVIVSLLAIVGILLFFSAKASITERNDKQSFINLKVVVKQESEKLHNQATPTLTWRDSSSCDYNSSEISQTTNWSCSAEYATDTTADSATAVHLKQMLGDTFKSSTDVFTIKTEQTSEGFPDKVRSSYILDATENKTGFKCSLAVENNTDAQPSLFYINLICNGSALKSWYPNSGIKNEVAPGSGAWKI